MGSAWLRKITAMLLIAGLLAGMAMETPARASSAKCVFTACATVYQKASLSSKKLASRDKGDKIVVVGTKGKWAKVKSGGKTGYVLKSKLKKAASSTAALKSKSASNSSAVGYKTLSQGSRGDSVTKLQTRLKAKGYLSASGVTGSYSSGTRKAVRMFQMVNGLTVTGKANAATQKKLYGSSKSLPNVSKVSWRSSGMSYHFPKGSLATIVDLSSGIRLRIRRVGGVNHADVEPATASDTAKLKKIYGGTFSWNSKGVLFLCDGKYYAAAINGYPHGKEISTSNNYDGQFCLHLNGSKTHGTESSNANHQRNVRKVYNYFH